MSNLLTDDVKKALKPEPLSTTLVITVGNALRGDDGVGPYIAESVKKPVKGIKILDVADRPENGIDPAVETKPKKTVVIDAARFGGKPGEAKILPENLIPDTTLSTHSFPLKIITRMLESETGSQVFFLGIEPKNLGFGEGLSVEVKKTADEIISILKGVKTHA